MCRGLGCLVMEKQPFEIATSDLGGYPVLPESVSKSISNRRHA